MIGKSFSHYRVTEKIGAGGMGEVFRATDSKLGRDVALKMLPAEFARDAERMARFQREAQVLASLNHPNIAAIYGLEEHGTFRVLVLELVEGPSLMERLRSGAIPVAASIDIARQIAEAVEYAHERGVIHRDLKPDNVKVTDEGRVKVLDFGLAKAFTDPGSDSESLGPDSPTISPLLTSPLTGALTGANVILGTAAYMSPEQARGRAADRRSDVWSFGAMLFEMLSGRRLFAGETVSDTVAAILKTEPDWSLLPSDTPPRLRELLERCLAKDARQRVRDMGDVRLELEWIQAGKGAPAADAAPAPAGSADRLRIPVAAAAVLGLLGGALLWGVLAGRVSGGNHDEGVTRLSIAFPEELAVAGTLPSPDGTTILVWGRPRHPATDEEKRNGLYLRALDDYEFRPVPGSRGVAETCFSPDSRWLAVAAPQDPNSTKLFLWKIPVDGSAPPLKLLDWNEDWSGLHWLPDETLVTGAPGKKIVRLPTDGSPADEPLPLQTGDLAIEYSISPDADMGRLLPDGHHLLTDVEVWNEGGYRQDIVMVDVRDGVVKRLLENGGSPTWSPTGHLLFSRGSSVLAAPFDPGSFTLTGGPTALIDDVRITVSWGHGSFDLADDGTLSYFPGGFVGGGRRLVWLDRDFHEIGAWSDETFAAEDGPLPSPDGTRIAIVQSDPEGVYDIWLSEPDRPVMSKWLEEPGRDCIPSAWLPDGSGFSYQSRTATETLHSLIRLDDRRPVLLLADRDSTGNYSVNGFADGGASAVFTAFLEGASRIERVDVAEAAAGRPRTEVVLEHAANAAFSRDGQWMAYLSDESGRWEIYVRRWRGHGELGPAHRASENGIPTGPAGWWSGTRVWWLPATGDTPRELWYRRDRDLLAVTVDDAGRISRPRIVAQWPDEVIRAQPVADGRWIAVKYGENEDRPKELRVILGWRGELDRRAGR
jgi:eukaryotic-like serine/threonine-protein kinase